jgi:light-regulated signal transduction histidine kinase (bacteriophytochrome)
MMENVSANVIYYSVGTFLIVVSTLIIFYFSLLNEKKQAAVNSHIKLLEAEKEKLQQSIAQISILIEQKEVELIKSIEDKERFVYTAAHDLQEPLRMVSSFLFLLEKNYGDRFDENAQQYVKFAVEAGERMKKLIADLLEFSRVGQGNQQMEQVDLNEVLENVKSIYAINHENGILESEGLPVIFANRTQMIQLFQNLIGNSIKYVPKGAIPSIKITCLQREKDWVISVTDKGIGIQKEYLVKVFDLFNRLHKKSEYSGSGIGLAICKKIVEQHNGKIWAESADGKGSKFSFTLRKTQ